MMITTTDELAAFCATISTSPYITVDTEFMRERTYWPKLCLVQVANAEHVAAIDPLAKGMDLQPLLDLLHNPSILKVFHAARQDVEIFYNMTGKVPAPMFDTQVAAMVCGYGESASYETLASQLAGAKVDKSSRFTDWAHRPLTEKQVEYALGDVTHLRIVYEKLRDKLKKTGREGWLGEEMGILTNPNTYKAEPMEMWRKLKMRADKPRLRALVRELAAWREVEAQRINVPRQRVIRDEALMEIAYHPPESVHDLARIRGLGSGFAEGRQGAEVLDAVARANALPLNECPTGEQRRILPSGIGPVMDLLKVLLKQVSEEQGVAAKLIATTDDLEDLAADDNCASPVMQGWRRELFGDLALSLKQGKIGLAVQKGKIRIIPL